MTATRSIRDLTVLVAAAVIATGCSGGSGQPTASTSPSSIESRVTQPPESSMSSVSSGSSVDDDTIATWCTGEQVGIEIAAQIGPTIENGTPGEVADMWSEILALGENQHATAPPAVAGDTRTRLDFYVNVGDFLDQRDWVVDDDDLSAYIDSLDDIDVDGASERLDDYREAHCGAVETP